MHEILFISLLTRSQCTPFSRIKDFFLHFLLSAKAYNPSIWPDLFCFRAFAESLATSHYRFVTDEFPMLLLAPQEWAFELIRMSSQKSQLDFGHEKSGITKKGSATLFFDTSTCKKQKLLEIMTITLSLPHNWRAAKQFENTIRAYQEIQNGAQFLGFLFVTPRNLSGFFAGLFWQTSSELTSFQGS